MQIRNKSHKRVITDLRIEPISESRDIEISGIDRLNECNLVVKARIKTSAMEHTNIKREYLRLMKLAFQKAKIKPPYTQVIIHRSK